MSITTDRTDVPVAIVGMACRLPGAANLEQYWQLISQGKSAVGEVPPERLNRDIYYHPEKGTRGKTYSTKAALLHDRTFNRQRCPLPQSLIDSVDNTHLLMTEVAAEAFRHAGYDPFQLPNRNVSVFIGHAQGSSRLGELTFQTYLDDAIALLEQTPGFHDLPVEIRQAAEQELLAELNQQLPPGPDSTRFLNCNMVAGTVAKAFGLDGSWLALNSACASSLHAMLMGARALQRGRADAVVVGGASDCKSDSLVLFSNAQTLTKDDSRPFDANADGLIMSEGYVALVMKTLDRAIADGDPIQAVVRGLGVATDGRGKSLWAPRKEGQMRAMRRAYRSGADASRLQYQECHATATQVGDATELETLREVLQPQFAPGKKIPITSAKANIGHSLEAAGIAGMIKTVLCMQHKQFPAAINIQELNPKVPWDESPFFVPMQPAVWEAPEDGGPRCAGVNAFGIGGLNMHVVIDEYVGQTPEQICGPSKPATESAEDRAIAVVGMGCIVPGADELDQFWNLVQSGTDPKSQPPGDRWSPQSRDRASREGYAPLGGFIEKYEYDWRKHRVPPKQVQEADPLQFMFLDASEKALADAGYDRDSIPKELAGVVVCTEFGGDFSDQLEMGLRIPEMQAILARRLAEKGLSPEQINTINENFSKHLLKKWPALVDETGSFTSSTLASRISKTLDLKGGAVAIDSGATSGMSGIALCIDSLLSGDNDMMICAAGQRRMGPTIYDGLKAAGLLSKDGQAKELWDAEFSGIVPGEGVAVVVLKRLADARRDGDKIRAVIRGLGTGTHDNPAEAMRLAVERSSAMAGIDPAEVEFVDLETDESPEVCSSSLSMIAHSHVEGARQHPLSLASTTAQFGQMGGGGPMLALVKAALESQNQEVAQGIGVRKGAGPNLETVLRGNTKLSQRGLGGVANWAKGQAFYLLLDNGSHVTPKPESATPAVDQAPANADAKLIRLGAASHQELLACLNDAVNSAESTWNAAGKKFAPSDAFRLAIVADSLASFTKKLAMASSQLGNASAQQVLEQQGIFYRQRPQSPPRVAFVFPGQGSQYEGMLKELVAVSPEAAKTIAEADAAMQRQGFPTFSQLAWETPTQLGKDVFQTQIAMLLADLTCLATLKHQGITPDLVLGHSYGEFPALYAAGVWNLDDVIRMTKARCDGILATSKNDAGLLATTAAPEVIKQLIAECGCQAYLANFNAPDQTVIGGKLVALQQLATALKAKSYPARILAVPAAFHTPLMAGSSRLLQQALETATLATPSTTFVSTVDNQQVTDVQRIKRNLGIQLTTPVKYVPLIEQLDQEAPTVFVEVGPQQTLTKLNRKILSGTANVIAVDNPKRGALESLLGVQALLDCLGVGEASAQSVPPKPNFVPETSAAPQRAEKPALTPSHEMNLMDDIPHFDATERRRAKMRGASDRPTAAAPQAQPAPPAAPPQPVAPPPVSPPKVATPTPPAPKPVPPITPPSAPVVPQPVVPPVAPSMNGSGNHYTNGSTNGSANGAATKSAPKSNAVDLEKFLVNFVVEQTGYPPEVVDLDADLEADLGIDSIKKAQLFGELQEYFEISTSATELSLDDFPTLRHVVDFLSANGEATSTPAAAAPEPVAAPPAPAPQPIAPPVAAPAPVAATPEPAAPSGSTSPAELEAFLVNFVVEQTGYPPEVVDLDADLEADLGIDSIKKAQLFGELQEYFEISTSATELSLDDFPTLRHVVDFLSANGQATSEAAASPAPAAAVAPIQPPPPQPSPPIPAPPTNGAANGVANGTAVASSESPANPAELESFLVNFVVEQTGYPPEVVDLDADLEADLGIDSIKKAQLFGELQEYFEISTSATELSLDDFPTLRHVLDFLSANGQQVSATSNANEASSFSPAAPAPARETKTIAPAVASPSKEVEVADNSENQWNENASSLQTLAGTPYEMGFTHGSVFRSEIRRTLQTYAEYVGESVDELPGSQRCQRAFELLSPDQLDELQGIADAVEAPLTNLLVHHFVTAELLSQSDQVATEGGIDAGMKHVARITSQAMGPLRETVRLATFLRQPSEGIPHVGVTAIGTVYCLGGMNRGGLTATASGDPDLLHILGTSPTLEDAIDATSSFESSPSGSVTFSDRSTQRLATMELTSQGVQIASDGPVARQRQPELVAASGVSTLAMADSDWSETGQDPQVEQDNQDALVITFDHAANTLSVKCSLGQSDAVTYDLALLEATPDPKLRTERIVNHLPLAAPNVTARFEMEMRDAPLSASAATSMTWQGAAVVLGSGPTADALLAKLQENGVVVYHITDAMDLDTAVSQVENICEAGPAPHLFITTGRDGYPAVAMADPAKWSSQQRVSMETPLFVCQKWLSIADKQGWLPQATVVATTSLGGDFGFESGSIGAHSGALTGLMKAIFIEYTVMRGGQGPRVKAFDTSESDCPGQIAEDIIRELASGNLDYEVSWSGGSRRVPFAVDIPAERIADDASLPHGAWVVTGGARGITAACALELGKRYGLRLHLLGSSPLPEIDPSWRTLDEDGLKKLKAETMIAARKAGQPAPQAWERVQKSLEIDRSLRAFEEAGVSATYHVCDVSSRDSLANVLDSIRRTDGPISGILHGAGIDKSCRFEKKRVDVVNATIGIKAGGLVHLAALTRKDPIRHVIGFGSIAGRLGSFGQADYCQASDLLCKLMGAYRRQRPWVRAVGFHWHGWDEVGMAARPETQSVLQEKSELTLMPLAEGLGHFIREIEADAPRSEILITERRHWQRFADGLGKLAESKSETPSQETSPASPSTEPLGPPDASVELRTQRCELKLIEAPLGADSPAVPTFSTPVWIVGDNADAIALEAKLAGLGAEVYRFGIREDLDALLAELDGLHPDRPAGHLFLLSARDAAQADMLSAEAIEKRRHDGIIAPFFIAQSWYKRLIKLTEHGPGTLVAATSLGGDFGFESTVSLPDGGGMAGFVKSLHIEDSRRDERAARCKVIDSPAGESSQVVVDALLREAASYRPEVEVSWNAGKRCVVRPIPVDLPLGPLANIPQGGVWVVTGGARGITAIAARELARRYGWKLHLFGKSPPPIVNAPWRNFDEEQLKTYKTQITRQAVADGQSPGAAWDRVLKDCEIFNNLQKFAEAGIQATYHQCDVTSRDELSAALDKVRATDGPVTGLMHGAGLIEPGRFEHKRRGFVEKLVRTKFDGLMHLLALTKNDPLTHCIGFGSISGRFGGNGLSDYAAGNDSMSKALDWHRKASPDCTTLCIHWESWEGAGIATLSRFAWGPRSVMKMKYMLPEEGVRRLEEEMAGGGKKAETLYTFGDFYPMFYPEEQYPLGEFQPRSGEEASDVPLIQTTRREGDELIGDVPLDPTADPFLIQHRLRGKPIMPVVATLEALREAAAIASGKTVVAFRDVDMVDGLVFHTDNPQTAQARSELIDDQLVQCRWTCDFRNRTGGLIQKDRLYLEAKAVVADSPAAPTTTLPTFPSEWHAVEYPEDSAIYHGQPFRCLKAISCEASNGWGHIVAQPLVDLTGESKRDGWIVPSCVLDSALYACGCHLYLHGEGAVSLPRKIELLELGRVPQDGENCYVHFTCRNIAEKSALYDMVVVGQDGTVILKATGYEKVILMRGEVK
ncbi:type I polyketide synthase [Bremerella sp. P1]|uniref:type I polyketide synthase n=1 Tax=Bremerella sp. P1 TaxID=3026424 RepID=UPI0023674C74|nr:type I polyketide synthase [Bremerella sp. P1]WDI40985.1 SDR family NAD(P)-dependent oxidoreductase [Bremerella sp. P1]